NGRVRIDNWPGNPWSRGGYSFYRPGQYTKFGGAEGEPENNAHFCGEHTSAEWQGFMNGAVATGERAAREILGA
ncbi:MAG TPA: FAD-dependent oxidoreductase, partial [Bryobacteraceae bacterium]|nr:FAD-dependent oxidoreductase [Bryobacteraceae bacterium]